MILGRLQDGSGSADESGSNDDAAAVSHPLQLIFGFWFYYVHTNEGLAGP